MHASHQKKLLNAGFTIYSGDIYGAHAPRIKVKTPADHNWKTFEKDFKSKAELKRRLDELDKKPMWIDLYDTKNSPISGLDVAKDRLVKALDECLSGFGHHRIDAETPVDHIQLPSGRTLEITVRANGDIQNWINK